MKLWKYSGTLLVVTGILHSVIAIFTGRGVYSEMIQDGVINSVGHNLTRDRTLWFLVCGILIILLGQTLNFYIKKEQKPAPLFLGYSLLVFSIIGCLLAPISGFWLFIPQAVIIICGNKREG